MPEAVRAALGIGLAQSPSDRHACLDPLLAALAGRAGVADGSRSSRYRPSSRRWSRSGLRASPDSAPRSEVHRMSGRGTSPPDPDALIARIWNDARRTELRVAFHGAGARGDAAAIAAIAALDHDTVAWRIARADACPTRPSSARARACPRRATPRSASIQRLPELDATVGVLARADADAIARSVELIAQLGDLATCREATGAIAELTGAARRRGRRRARRDRVCDRRVGGRPSPTRGRARARGGRACAPDRVLAGDCPRAAVARSARSRAQHLRTSRARP